MSCLLRHKLAEERGASIILALVLFLICALVAGIIVSGASVNVERTTQEVKEEQAYLDLRSAGQAVQRLFDPTGTHSDGSNVIMDFSNPSNPFDGNSLLQRVGKGSNLAQWIITNSTSVKNSGVPANGESNPWETSVESVSPYGNESYKVKVSFWMDEDYKIYALFSVDDTTSLNNTQLKMIADPVRSGAGDTLKLTWSGSELYKVVE